jgi:hypothetical protein
MHIWWLIAALKVMHFVDYTETELASGLEPRLPLL